MRRHLEPFVSVSSGAIHPNFPRTFLHYWLLSESDLDNLAQFYHQVTPSVWTNQYPEKMRWRHDLK
ncbi:hypothetical protein VE03_10306, partial [Pseudogymnoascus sp. 23342-1-I1]